MGALPATWAELIELARAKLFDGSDGHLRVYSAAGDEFSEDALELIRAHSGQLSLYFAYSSQHPAHLTKATPPPTAAPKRLIEISKVDVVQVSTIDVNEQSFSAMLFAEFMFPGGALDEDLVRPSSAFPLGDDGKPTFRPSAHWYVDRNGRGVRIHRLQDTAS